jgi:hypothetical protein
LTFDVDWAPDSILDFVFNILECNGVKSTWFFTHQSPVIEKMVKSPLIEVGIHPNFLPGSTQGQTQEEVMKNLAHLFPDARCVRTHAMFYSASIAEKFARFGMTIDSSIYHPGANPYRKIYNFGGDYNPIYRIPYTWADDAVLVYDYPFWRESGVKYEVMCFHPIHIYLNSTDMQRYKDWKACKGVLTFFSDTGSPGIGRCLIDLIAKQDKEFKFLSEVVNG